MNLTVYVKDTGETIRSIPPAQEWLDGRNLTTDDRAYAKFFLAHLKQFHIAVAKDVLSEEQKKGFVLTAKKVDGVLFRDEEHVKDFGMIEYFSPGKYAILDALLKTYQDILHLSKVVTGLYQGANVVFWKGKLIAKNLQELEAWTKSEEFDQVKTGDLFRYANLMPYARKLELGGQGVRSRDRAKVRWKNVNKKRKGNAYRIDANTGRAQVKRPNGTYYLSYRRAARNFAGTAMTTFEFLPGNYLGIQSSPYRAGFRTTFSNKFGKGRAGRPYLYPTIVVAVIGDMAGDTAKPTKTIKLDKDYLKLV